VIDPRDIVAAEHADDLVESGQPEWVDPMLATLTDERFSDPDWIFERKLDGERCIAYRSGSDTRLVSRNRKDIGTFYPELQEALASQAEDDFVVDGEIVAFSGGVTSFERLAGRMHLVSDDPVSDTGVAVYYYLFDIVHLNGFDVSGLPLRERKRLLRRAIDFADPLRFAVHRNTRGEEFYEEACRKGWEGVIAKDATSPYVHGRSKKWLKFKCVLQQELVVGGFTDPRRSRVGFGALLLGYHDDGDFVYAGKVGTGFDDTTLERLRGKLDRIERSSSPFDRGEAPEGRHVHYVTPRLVAEIGFAEWTSAGHLRHPRFLGLRDDKDAGEVVREKPEGAS